MSFLPFLTLLAAGQLPHSIPDVFDMSSRTALLTVHATGAQIYECQAKAKQNPAWSFREPIAALMEDGTTIGRHFAGPTWQFDDGSLVTGKQIEATPGASATDVPQLKLNVVGRFGRGRLDGVAHVYRIDTNGGALTGPCQVPGELKAITYEAIYVFTD